MAATYDGDGNRVAQSSLYHAERQLNADTSGLGALPALDLDSRFDDGSVIHSGISAFTYGFVAMATAFGSSICAPVMPWALDAIMAALASSTHGAKGLPDGVPGLVMDNKAIMAEERDAIASAIGLIPRGLSTIEETFDVVSYVNSTLTSTAQVMSSSSSRSGATNETYGIARLASTSSSATSFFLNDERGSVVQTTNAQGSSTSWRSYSAFGQIEASSDLGELPTYGYNAEEQHPTTGLTYLRFRYYEAKTSTFGVQDTYLGNIFSPLTLNRYLYCLANPVNYVDPSGHFGRVLIGSALTPPNAPKFKFHGGTPFTDATSFANDPGQKTIEKPDWKAYSPALTFEDRKRQAAKNELLWHYELAKKSGNQIVIAYHMLMAKKIKQEYEAFYCGTAALIHAFEEFKEGYESLSDREKEQFRADVIGFFPYVGPLADFGNTFSYLADGNFEEAGYSGIGIIPYVGDGAKFIVFLAKTKKIANKTSKMIEITQAFEKASLDRSKKTAQQIISEEKDASLDRVFPGEWKYRTLEEIEAAAKQGDASARTAKKLLNDHRFDKGDNRK